MFSSSFRRGIAVAALLTASFGLAYAADVNGRIKGTVTDPGGAVVPLATVTATNQDTGVKTTITTQADGDYTFQQLPVGTYTITVTAAGFKSFSASGIVLNIDQEFVESVKLTLGNATDVVEIVADAVQVNTTDMQLSNIVNSAQIVELPLIGRNFTGLETILPGVQLSSDRFGAYSVSGAQTQQSEFLINGADSNDIALNTLSISPNLDAIDQFNLIDGPLNAEYDRNSGGIVSATIKQGTNKFHGDGFEFYRDTFLNQLSYFQKVPNPADPNGKWTGTPSPYHQNIFGGTVGGPIFKDKLFFFGAYQGIHQRTPGNGAAAIYNTANLAGNFSADIPSNTPAPTAANPGYGPFTANPIPSTITIAGCTTAGETWAQCAYSNGGIFPASGFNSISTALINKYIPTTDINGGSNGYTFPGANTTTSNQEIGRFDYTITPRDQVSFLGIYFKQKATAVLPFTGASVPGFGEFDNQTIQQYTFDFVHQFSSNTVNDFAAHWTRFNYQAVEPQTTVAPSTFGFDITPENTAAESLPTISVSGIGQQFALGFSTNGPQPRIDQVYQLDETISKTFGHHQLKFGYDGRRFNVSNPFNASNSGSFGFNNGGTYTSGDGGLDFLYGVPASYGQGSGAQIQADAFLNYFFAQDSWRITEAFTLDYGLGYSIDTPLRNHQYGGEGIACLVPGQQSKLFSTAPVGIAYPGDPGCSNSGQATTRYSEFGPRFGFAWAPDLGFISGGNAKKFSIRAGFGIYYNRTEEESSLQTLQTPPFGIGTGGAADFGGSPQFANPYADINGGGSEPNKFPFIFPTKGQNINFGLYEPLGISTYSSNFRAPYSENIQISVEREFAARTVVRASYVASLGRHNQITYEGNYETAAGHAACLADAELSPVLGKTISCVTNRNLQSFYFPQNTFAGAVDPNTGLTGITSVGTVGSESSSTYHSFQASVEKGLTHGLFFQLSYTYAHAIDDGSNFENSGFGENGARGYNQFVKSLNYGDSTFDVRHHLVFSPVYTTPQRQGAAWYAPSNLALGGWEISGIATVAGGFPYDISYAGSVSRSLYCSASFQFYACPDVPLQTAPLVRQDPRARNSVNLNGGWFANTSFAPEPIGTFGNIHRDPYHGPGVNNTNLIVAKNFLVGSESQYRLQIRMESDNAFNHTQFTNPQTNYSSGTFGQVAGTQPARLSQLGAKFYF